MATAEKDMISHLDPKLLPRAGAVASLRGVSRHEFVISCIEAEVQGYLDDAILALADEKAEA